MISIEKEQLFRFWCKKKNKMHISLTELSLMLQGPVPAFLQPGDKWQLSVESYIPACFTSSAKLRKIAL
ncbi:hypothetical protein [Bacillus paramycoides]|uniref:hypothetical protein n=1 Tax=Bacillus paramycoides TaxID=2026194 RepID=UPI003D068352